MVFEREGGVGCRGEDLLIAIDAPRCGLLNFFEDSSINVVEAS